MKFFCDQSQLSEAVGIVSRAAAVKSTLGALEGIVIETKKDSVTLKAYDLDIGIEYTMPARVENSGSIVMPCKLFGDIVRKLPSGEAMIVTDEKFMTVISVQSVTFTILGLSSDEFPELPELLDGDELSVDASVFRSMLRQTVFAAAEAEDKPILQGILIEISPDDKKLCAVAVDGYRLAKREDEMVDYKGAERSFVIPKKTVHELLKVLPEEEEMILNIYISKKHLMFRLENTVMYSRRLEGEFLNYQNAIPKTQGFIVKMKTRQFITAIEQAALIATGTLKIPIRCLFDYDAVKISTASTMGKFYDEFNTEVFNNRLEIGFNHRYMLDALNACGCDEIYLELTSSRTPIVIKSEKDDKFIFLVLPVRMTSDE